MKRHFNLALLHKGSAMALSTHSCPKKKEKKGIAIQIPRMILIHIPGRFIYWITFCITIITIFSYFKNYAIGQTNIYTPRLSGIETDSHLQAANNSRHFPSNMQHMFLQPN